MGEYYCPNCNADLDDQIGFDPSNGTWTCTECGHINGITDDDILENEHTCPNCGANLKKKYDYSKYSNEYTCTECGADLYRDYSNDEFNVIDDKDKCPNCGAFLKSKVDTAITMMIGLALIVILNCIEFLAVMLFQ